MTLTRLFRLHIILAVPYGLGLILIPQMVVGFFSEPALGPPGVTITRLFGAALLLVAMIAWGASEIRDVSIQRMIARSLFFYTSLGFLITLTSQLAGMWNPFGWINVISYVIFVLGYGFFSWRKPGSAG